MSLAETAHRVPRTTDQAAQLCERFALLRDQIGAIEGRRNAQIAAANSEADAAAASLLAECAVIQEKLLPWWAKAAADLTKGKRKSIELGGCLIGSKAGRDSLGVAGAEDDIVKALQKRSWAEPLLRVKTTLDKRTAMLWLEGAYSKQLIKLGLSKVTGDEKFFVERAEQAGTLAEVQS